VLLGGDNTDNAQTNELEWFMGILDGAPKVECDSALDDDLVPGPDNDQKDPFGPVGLDIPWRWVTGNHDILRQGTWPISSFMKEPTGDNASGGTRDYSQPGSPIVTGTVPADPRRAFLSEADQLQRLAAAGDGHGITAEAMALGRAYYTFDIEGTPLRVFVISTAAATGSSQGLIRQLDIDTLIEPALQAAAAADKYVIVTSHHRSASMHDGTEPGLGVGTAFPDALTTEDWISYLGTHPHVIMQLAAHSHTMSVIAQEPLGGHAYWEMVSPSLADFPHQLRMLEIWDQDNGFLTIRSVAFDIVTEGDPLAETGRTVGYLDYTSGWNSDGRGKTPEDRNVELWIAKP
jgi:3',5'-cyclic AMP phosphodiesterase CpdA